ncbi:MAG: hypothetical protein ACRD7E_17085 [Bryobacteraceae bacterium]
MEEYRSQGRRYEYPYLAGIAMDLRNLVRCVGPSDDVVQHFRNARVEVLKGFRQIIDERIDWLNQKQKGTRVEVD